MVSGRVTILLGDFGATTNQERLDGQTGIFTEHYADRDARFKNFSWASDIYSFGLSAYFILWGRHLYTRDNHQQWLDNSEKGKNAGSDAWFLQAMTNLCIDDDVSKRPRFDTLAGEISVELIEQYCYEKDPAADKKAVEFIEQNEFPVNYQKIGSKNFSL